VIVSSSIPLKTGLLSPLKLHADPSCSLALPLAVSIKAGTYDAKFYIDSSTASKEIDFSPNQKVAAHKAQGKRQDQ
jgi:hypothetical protein